MRARDALFAAAYSELHRAGARTAARWGHNTVLDTTCLVHESYLRFVSAGELRAEDRRAFFAYASQVMRSVIVNSVRERIAQKRGGIEPRSPYPRSWGAAARCGADRAGRARALEALEQRILVSAGRADALLWGLQRAGDRRNAGCHRTYGTARLGEGTTDPRGRMR